MTDRTRAERIVEILLDDLEERGVLRENLPHFLSRHQELEPFEQVHEKWVQIVLHAVDPTSPKEKRYVC